MADFIQPLDFWTLLVNTLSGNIEIFAFLFFMVTSFICAKYRVPDGIYLVIISLGALILVPYLSYLMVILILVVGLITFYGLAKILR